MKAWPIAFLVLVATLMAPPAARALTMEVTPENPVQGDVLGIMVKGTPGQQLTVKISFQRNLDVANGKYLLSVESLTIPVAPNKFKVTATSVKDMTLTLIKGTRISTTVQTTTGTATKTETDLPEGIYDCKVRGNAVSGASKVGLLVEGESTVTLDADGEYYTSYTTSTIPPGDFTVRAGGETLTVKLSAPAPPPDTVKPTITGNQPTATASTSTPQISASYSDDVAIDVSRVSLALNGADVTSAATATTSKVTYTPPPLGNNTSNTVHVSVSDTSGNTQTLTWNFNVFLPPPPDVTPPTITAYQPKGDVADQQPNVAVSFTDDRRIQVSSIRLIFDGLDVTSQATVNDHSATYGPPKLENNSQHTVTVKVSDKSGNQRTHTWSFKVVLPATGPPPTIVNQPPDAVAGHPTKTLTGKTVTFDASRSSDPDGVIVEYTWALGDGAALNGIKVNHQYTQPGEYTVTLTVRDDRGASTEATSTITVLDAAQYKPTAEPGSPRTVYTGSTVNFNAVGSSSISGEITSYTWGFGDGDTGSGLEATHRYNSSGKYTITLTVVDNIGASGTAQTTIKVVDPPALAHIRETPLGAGAQQVEEPNMGARVRLNATGQVTLHLSMYPSSEIEPPANAGKYSENVIDVSVSNPDTVEWPIYVEFKYNITSFTGVEHKLGLYVYVNGTWRLCARTGVNTTAQTVWAYMSREETTGSPTLIGEVLTPPDIRMVELTAPDNLTLGEVGTITLWYRNDGDMDGEALVAFTVDLGELQLDTLQVSGHSTSSIQFQVSFSEPGAHTVYTPSQNHTIRAVPPPPDLSVRFVEPLPELTAGQSVTLSLRVINDGGWVSNATEVSVQQEEAQITDLSVEPLSPGDDVTLSFVWRPEKPGSFQLSAVVDPMNALKEADKANNQAAVTVQVKPEYSLIILGVAVAAAIAGVVIYKRGYLGAGPGE